MHKVTRPFLAATVAALSCVGGCENLLAPAEPTGPGSGGSGGTAVAGTGGAVNGGSSGGSTGTGGRVTSTGGRAPGTGGSGSGGLAVGTGGAGSGGRIGSGGSPGSGGSAGSTGVGGADTAACSPYPAAPTIENTSFKVGTVAPNLVFSRQDGSSVSFQDLRCNKKNRLLYWTTGGDNCSYCWDNANDTEVPASKELGPQGFVLVASFNGSRYLVGNSPWVGWRRYVPIWPATDSDSIMLVSEPTTKPFYAFDRITFGLPWEVTIDMETMKVISVDATPSLATLRTQLAATTPRR